MPFLIERFMRTSTFPEWRKKLPGGFLPEVQRFYYDTAQASNAVALSCARQVIPASHFVFGEVGQYCMASRPNLTGILPQYATDKPVGATGRRS